MESHQFTSELSWLSAGSGIKSNLLTVKFFNLWNNEIVESLTAWTGSAWPHL